MIDIFKGIEVGPPPTSTSAAKSQLLAWAEENDAQSRKLWSRRGTIATSGALAALGALVLVRTIVPPPRYRGSPVKRVGRRLISWALIAKTGKWLLPHVIRAVRSHAQSTRPTPV